MTTVNPDEINNFTSQAAHWWDETGPFKPLHKINPVRLAFVCSEIKTHFSIAETTEVHPLKGLRILDIGCGGGLLCEPLARLGADVTGLDAGQGNIDVARAHAKESALNINYLCQTAEDLAATGVQFDVVTALEIVEHVADVDLFMSSCSDLVRPGGQLFMSTLNRTVKSYALGIVAAEYLLRWVPKGTHQWRKFLKPSELSEHLEKKNIHLQSLKGISLDPFTNTWKLSTDLDVNYLFSALKKE